MTKIYNYFSSIAAKLKSTFFYCGLTKNQFNSIQDIIVSKNKKVLYAASIATTILGAALFIVNIPSASLAIYPCLFMMVSGILIFLTKFIPNKKQGLITFLCYLMLILLLTSSAAISFLPSNRDIPATAFIAFLALIPLLISDSPSRMIPVVILSGTLYVVLSYFLKEPLAFKLDLINTIIFLIVGISLYIVAMKRTAKRILQKTYIESIQKNIINTLASVIEARDGITGERTFRTQNTVDIMIEEMKHSEKYKNLPDDFFDNVYKAAPLHDIGKIRTPDSILSKPGKLTPDEYEIIKKHTIDGSDIVEKITNDYLDKQFSQVAYNVVKYHHEKWDGTGYPCN